jgi:hypothetical protein
MSGRSKLSGGKGKVSTQQAITGFLVKAAEKQTIKVKVTPTSHSPNCFICKILV